MLFIDEGTDIIIWGCGYRAKWFTEKYKDRYNICYYVDSKVHANEKIYTSDGHAVYNPEFLRKEDLSKCTVIIAIDKWEEVLAQLNIDNIKLFENCIPWEYTEYLSIDLKFLKLISAQNEKERSIRRLARDKTICIAFGFCHLQVYKTLLMNNNQFTEKYIFVDLPAINDRENEFFDMWQEKAIYSTCDVLLFGVVPGNINIGLNKSITENINEYISSDRRVISITSAAFKGYFPQHTEHRNDGCDENGIPIRKYFAWGDKNINKMFKMGLSADDIIKKIMSTDYYEEERCRKYFEHEFMMLEKAEEKCDVKIADYLRTIYDKTIAYYSWTHPIPVVLIEIARRIALALGIEDDFMRFKDESFLDMKSNEEIVYPSVLKALGLCDKEYLCRKIMPGHMLFKGTKLTTEEYVSKYIEYVSMR